MMWKPDEELIGWNRYILLKNPATGETPDIVDYKVYKQRPPTE